jgi:hypothetical protein
MIAPARPAVLLRLDGFAVALLAVFLYRELGASWWLFAGLFLAPDIAFLAYLVNRTAAPVVYNVLHTYVVPAVCFLAGLRMQHAPLMGVGLIWIAHIGVDRMLGFGLKYAEGFRVTHLQKC